jgi:hypothetical protein
LECGDNSLFCLECEVGFTLFDIPGDESGYGFCMADRDSGNCIQGVDVCQECSDNVLFCNQCTEDYELVNVFDEEYGFCMERVQLFG